MVLFLLICIRFLIFCVKFGTLCLSMLNFFFCQTRNFISGFCWIESWVFSGLPDSFSGKFFIFIYLNHKYSWHLIYFYVVEVTMSFTVTNHLCMLLHLLLIVLRVYFPIFDFCVLIYRDLTFCLSLGFLCFDLPRSIFTCLFSQRL